MGKFDRIELNPKILLGKPIIKGTRMPVALILNLLARSYTIERILKAYPNLRKEDVLAAIRYSESRLKREEILPLAVFK